MASRFSEYIRPPRKLRFTRDGRWFVTMTVLVGVGAINTGNNLLYLLLGMMLGLIIVSGVLSERVLREVTARRLPAGDLFAGRANPLRYEVRNDKRWFASYSLTVQEHEARDTRARRRRALGLPPVPPTRRKEREAEADPGGPRALAIRIPARSSVVVTSEYVFPVRGHYRYAGLDVATRFPFGFFEKARSVREPHEVLVYPQIVDGYAAFVSDDPRDGELERQLEGQGGEFFGLREFRDGDDMRDVHWKVSARRGQWVRRLYDKRDDEAVAVHLYNWVPPAGATVDDTDALNDAERAIVAAASICAELTRRGHRFSLHTIDEQVPEGAGPGQLQAVLRTLALLDVRRDAVPPTLAPSRNENRVMVAPSEPPASAVRGIRRFVPLQRAA